MITNHIKLFGTNQIQVFKNFSVSNGFKVFLPQKESFQVSSLFEDGVQARTIKIDVFEEGHLKIARRHIKFM